MRAPLTDGAASGPNVDREAAKKPDHKVLTVIETALQWAAHSDELKFTGWGERGWR